MPGLFAGMEMSRITPVASVLDIGSISLLNSSQIDQRFTNVPGNGTIVTATLLGVPVILVKRAGLWYSLGLNAI